MPVEVKGRVVFNPENEDQNYTIDCKQLGISEEGSGSIEEDIEDLRSRIERAIEEEFHVEPKLIQLTGYTMSMSFSIEGPINKTLDEFTKKDGEKDK
jgi:hypothetical protein